MTHDLTQFLKGLDDPNVPIEHKLSAIEMLAHMMQGVVDWCWDQGVDPNELWTDGKNTSPLDGSAVVFGKHTIAFNEAAASADEVMGHGD